MKISRRQLFRSATVSGVGLHLWGRGSAAGLTVLPMAEAERAGLEAKHNTVIGMRFPGVDVARVAMIGVGGRGKELLETLLTIENVRITAICDIVRDKVVKAQALVEKAGQNTPAAYFKSDHDFEALCHRDDVDLVYIATPWDWHAPMAVFAMNSRKHAAVEVPAAKTLEECWQLVDASEKNRRHCVMLENCCYNYNEMMVLNMVRAGVFGELTHGEAAYIHDLRKLHFSKEGEGLWRRFQHLRRNGNLYPTHGLGPIAQYMSINRGDKFEYLVSMSSPEKGMTTYRDRHFPADDPIRAEKYVCGDMNTSLIRTAKGCSIVLQHDVTSPRPYDRINLISGTKGTFRDYPPRIFIDGQEKDDWDTLDKYKAEYEHPLWTKADELARKLGGQGDMGFLLNYRLINAMHEGLAPDMDVYDAASWSAPSPLSEMSVARNSAPVEFPDFTRGRWTEPR